MTVPAPTPIDEIARLARLHELAVLDSPPEPLFDTLARLASEACGTPIALVSLVDAERQWFKANVGLTGVNETPRDQAFCAHTICGDALFEVPDATRDPRFADNPLVTDEPGIRFYAGAPLVLPDGSRVGTLCVIDRKARRLDDRQAQTLRGLAAIASQALEMRSNLLHRSLSVRGEYERALADSEAHYRAIVEDQAELVSLARRDGELVYVNRAYARHFGRQPADLLGTNLYDLVEPADRETVVCRLAQVLETGEVRVGENRMLATDDSERWVAWTNSRQYDAQGRVLLHSVGRDITELKHAEMALRASQAFLHRTGRVAGVGGWELDLVRGALTWSEETRRIHEVDDDYQPRLEGAIDFYAPEARPQIQAAVETAMRDGTPWDLELPFVTAKGRPIWVRAVGEAEFENGQPVRLIGAFQDITQRKLLEQRLADSERFLRLITDNLPLRIAYVDRELRYRFVNLAHCQRFARPREQIVGHARSELTGQALDAEFKARLDAALAGQPQRFEYEEPVGGELRRIESQLIPDFDEGGAVRGLFSTGIDVTERSAAERALRVLTAIFDNTTDYVVQTDRHGRITYMNPAARRVAGMTSDEPVDGRNFADFSTPQTARMFDELIAPAIKAHGVWVGETTLRVAQGRVLPVSHMVIAHRDASGRIDRFSGVMRDISAEIAAQHEEQRHTAILRAVTDAIPTIVTVVGADLRYRFANSAFERLYGLPRERIVGHSVLEVLGPEVYGYSQPWRERALAGQTVHFERADTGPDRATHLSISYIPLRLDDGSVDGFVTVAQDITQHRHEKLQLLQLSRQDPLTGLLNRAGFEVDIEARLGSGEGPNLALLCIDLDRFKPVNDAHGHPVGDQVLKLFAQRLTRLVRQHDAVARLGGDEFAIVLGGLRNAASAQAVAQKVLDAAHAPFELGPLQLRIGASVGIAFGADPAVGWRELMARADAQLYQAKQQGRGRQAGASA